jgi:pimeloyl-ACP methyl ester carboxylesterase
MKLGSLGLAFVALLVMLGLTSSQRHDEALVRQPGNRRYGMPLPVAEVARDTWELALFSLDIYGRDWKDHAATLDPHPLLGGWSRCNDFISERFRLEAARQGLYVEVWRQETPVETLVVAFKGTNPLTLRDWKSNARWFLRAVPWYRDQYTVLSEAFSREFADWVATKCGPDPRLKATGHSLGGGLAQHFAYSFPETITRAGSAARVSYVCAFDPSPVTGWSSTSKPTRLRNAQGLLIDRIFEHGEILAYLRLFLSYLLPPSATNPAIREVRVNFDWTDWPIRSHVVMDRLANELARAAGQRIA